MISGQRIIELSKKVKAWYTCEFAARHDYDDGTFSILRERGLLASANASLTGPQAETAMEVATDEAGFTIQCMGEIHDMAGMSLRSPDFHEDYCMIVIINKHGNEPITLTGDDVQRFLFNLYLNQKGLE